MKIAQDILKGFLFGIGFSVASVLVFFIYLSQLQAGAEHAYSRNLKSLYDQEANDAANRISPEIIDFKGLNGGVVIISKVEISHLGPLGYYLKFKLVDSQGNIEICTQPIHPEYGNNGEATYQTSCNPMTFGSSEIENITVSVGLRRE